MLWLHTHHCCFGFLGITFQPGRSGTHLRGLFFHKSLQYDEDLSLTALQPEEARIKVHQAGICSTDLHILKGYMGFIGVPGHEFVGTVVEAPTAPSWIGKRVVGEINASCRTCETCLGGSPTHCPTRTVLGIQGRNGAFAEYLDLPIANLHPVPDTLTDDQAVFVEPLAAACEIPQQLPVTPMDRVVIVGDGKLGLLCGQVLSLHGCRVSILGRHPEHQTWLTSRGLTFTTNPRDLPDQANLVIEATGSPSGFPLAMELLRPRGTLILKSTYHGTPSVNLADIVIREITILGSRCGPFPPSLRLLEHHLIDVEPMIHARYALADGLTAMEQATRRGILKVMLHMD